MEGGIRQATEQAILFQVGELKSYILRDRADKAKSDAMPNKNQFSITAKN